MVRLAPALLLLGMILQGCSQQWSSTVDTVDPDAGARRAAVEPAPAAATDDRSAAKAGLCDFEGWSSDKDPAGLNIRAAPSARARIVGKLPPPRLDPDLGKELASDVRVVEAWEGWFRIEKSQAFAGGWISGRYLDFALQTDQAFEAPDPGSKVVATGWLDKDGGHPFAYRHPSDCRGEWVKLLVAGHDGVERPAWARGICGNQETSCDGVAGDPLPNDTLPAF